MAIKYVTNADGKGWLIVKYADGSTYPPLPQYLKVEFIKTHEGRDHFRILEGKNRNKTASVKRKSATESFLGAGHHNGPAKVKFNIDKKQLWFGDRGPYNAITLDINPAPAGTHDLEIPYEVHDLASAYASSSPFSTTWFRIGHSGDRFLHPGRISAGCVTVKELSIWSDLYNYLINSRKGDGISVGTIEIIEK